jgi:hypothetical protein
VKTTGQGHWDCDVNLTYTNCTAQAGQNSIFTYGAAWPSDYPANPIKDDPSAGDAGQMAAFSSRGPADDGRIKPDVVAPGTWILSGYSDKFQQQYDATPNPKNNAYQYDGWGYPLNQSYKYMGGTSMSNPLVAGGAAVVRDFYEKNFSANASAALVKATLVNTAVDLMDENNDGTPDNAYPIPNIHEGWGRVNLAAATSGTRQFVDGSTSLATAGTATYSYSVGAAGSPFKVTLAWSDYPSTTAAAKNLVNDLDLVVTAPDGTTKYLGNVFSEDGRKPAVRPIERTTSKTFTCNPREQGPGRLRSRATTFRTALSRSRSSWTAPSARRRPPPPPAPPANLVATAASSSQIDLSWTDASNNEEGFKIERCDGSGCSSFTPLTQTGANVTAFSDTGLAAGATYSYRVLAFNTAGGNSGYSNTAEATTSTVTPPPAPIAPSNLTATATSSSQIDLGWTDNSSDETGFEIERCQGPGCADFVKILQTAAGVQNYSDTGRAANTTYQYRVRAVNGGGGFRLHERGKRHHSGGGGHVFACGRSRRQ